MYFDEFKHQLPDIDPEETAEWLASFDQLVEQEGESRARFLVYKLLEAGPPAPRRAAAAHPDPLHQHDQPRAGAVLPRRRGDRAAGSDGSSAGTRSRWSSGRTASSPGSAGTSRRTPAPPRLYEVGFNHFFKGKDDGQLGDQIFYQGHAAPGIYARAFLEGRLTEDQLDHFRRETVPGEGLPSYPHPRLMPDFWEFPTVSMGIGPISAVYQARFNRYLQNRGQLDTSGSRVWAFVGDGETDEPETLGALHVASREGLDNLTFVVNCNLQRLDGPVRGNGKIIQELESAFRGAGWNVIKVIWAREWDELLARDVDGVLVQQMNETLDGEFQKYSVAGGAYIREHFFGPDPRPAQARRAPVRRRPREAPPRRPRLPQGLRRVQGRDRVQGRPDRDPRQDREGLDARPRRRGAQHHPPGEEAVRGGAEDLPRPARAADPGREAQGRAVLPPGSGLGGGPVPARAAQGAGRLDPEARRPRRSRCRRRPTPSTRSSPPAPTTPVSTTMVFTRILRNLIRDKELGPRIVPIIPDEARTFGMDPLFKEVGIYAALGQRYEPVDSDLVLSYREAVDGQVLEEGITEAGSMASLQAAATSYASLGHPTIPFYIFYSMFGFQRTGDQIWALGDARGRGFMMGATAGRTTLTGEGLQHDDGHSHLHASTVPNCRPYDPAYAYELAAIVRDGIERMYAKGEDVFYYVTIYNENYAQPRSPRASTRGSSAACTSSATRPTWVARRTGRGSSGRARSCSRSSRPRSCSPRSSASPRRSTRRPRSRSCAATPSRRSAGTGSTRTRRRACLRRHRCWAGRRPDHRRDRLAEGPARHGLALAAAVLRLARHRWLRPERHARSRCGRCSRSTPRTSLPRPSPSWPDAPRCRARRPPRAIKELGIDPEKLDPVLL